MGPAGRTAPTGARNRAGPRMGVGKSVVAAAGAGRRARGPGRAQRAAAAGSGLGRRRAASVLVSCFCKASFEASAACFCSLLCWLQALEGFPARRSLCLLLLKCCLSWVSELTWS